MFANSFRVSLNYIFVFSIFYMDNINRFEPVGIEKAASVVGESVRRYRDEIMAAEFTKSEFPVNSFQFGFIAYFFCRRGRVSFLLNSITRTMTEGDCFIGIGEQLFKLYEVTDDFEGIVILASTQFTQDSIAGLHTLWPYLMNLLQSPVIHLEDFERDWVERAYSIIRERISDTNHRFQREALLSQMRVLYFDICDALSRRIPVNEKGLPRSYSIFGNFFSLLGDNYQLERNVNWYSDKLCMTAKYLSEVVKSVSGMTAGEWITQFTIIELKRLLHNSDFSIKEIAAAMNFPNQSYLGKYFKNIVGVSPSDYRNGNVSGAKAISAKSKNEESEPTPSEHNA